MYCNWGNWILSLDSLKDTNSCLVALLLLPHWGENRKKMLGTPRWARWMNCTAFFIAHISRSLGRSCIDACVIFIVLLTCCVGVGHRKCLYTLSICCAENSWAVNDRLTANLSSTIGTSGTHLPTTTLQLYILKETLLLSVHARPLLPYQFFPCTSA